MTTLTVAGKTIRATEFTNVDSARRMCDRREWIVSGNGAFYLVRPVDAAKMMVAGYTVVFK